jgi:uncharacterized repeat protein (TIGR03803 family)
VVLRQFSGGTNDGAVPLAGLLEGSDGTLYGTTSSGGLTNSSDPRGLGTVFKLNTNGSGYQVLYRFTGRRGDGAEPRASLVEGTNGMMLYGTTSKGGTNGVGTVFKLNTNGTVCKVIHSFTGGDDDGASPLAGLTKDRDGALFGTTAAGGSNTYGVIFRLSADGHGYEVIYQFANSYGEKYPQSTLVEGTNGLLYGTTRAGGSFGKGALFCLNKNGAAYQVLHHFLGNNGDGANPENALVLAANGQLYGTTYGGGANDWGTVFTLSHDGTGYRVLCDLRNHATGRN